MLDNLTIFWTTAAVQCGTFSKPWCFHELSHVRVSGVDASPSFSQIFGAISDSSFTNDFDNMDFFLQEIFKFWTSFSEIILTELLLISRYRTEKEAEKSAALQTDILLSI